MRVVADQALRVLMVAERTRLAWIRMGIAMMGFGFVVARFGLFLREIAAAGGRPATHHLGAAPVIGMGLIVLGGLITDLATVEHIRFMRRYARDDSMLVKALSLVTVLAGVLVVTGTGWRRISPLSERAYEGNKTGR